DVSTASIETATANNPSACYDTYEGKQLPYMDGTFDLALSICVMHHINPSDWYNFVVEMRRVLKPNGMAIVFEHNPANILTRRVGHQCPFDKDAVLLKKKQLLRIFKKSEVKQLESRFILTSPAGNSFLRRIDRLFSLAPLGAQYYVIGVKDSEIED